MDMQALVDAMGRAGRLQRSNYHLTLGQLIAELEKANGTLPVVFDVGGAPGVPHSYRGYYSDLSFDSSGDKPLAHGFLQTCKGALGATFEGYKGGDFLMEKDTPLWTAGWGNCGRAIVGARVTADNVTLLTKQIDD